MQVFVIINNFGIMQMLMQINADVNAKGVCDKESIWNPSNCECECDKSIDFNEYLDDRNCKCKKGYFIN